MARWRHRGKARGTRLPRWSRRYSKVQVSTSRSTLAAVSRVHRHHRLDRGIAEKNAANQLQWSIRRPASSGTLTYNIVQAAGGMGNGTIDIDDDPSGLFDPNIGQADADRYRRDARSRPTTCGQSSAIEYDGRVYTSTPPRPADRHGKGRGSCERRFRVHLLTAGSTFEGQVILALDAVNRCSRTGDPLLMESPPTCSSTDVDSSR